MLVFPDLQPLPDGASAAAPDPLQLRFAAARPLQGGWRTSLAHELERDDLALAAPAEIVAAAAGLEAGEWWLATPMHWQAGMTSLFVPADALLHPSTEEAAEIATEFAATFGADGLALVPVAGGHWLLRGLATDGADAPEIRWMINTGNTRRENTQAYLIPLMQAAGFNVVADNCEAECVFQQRLPAMDYDQIGRAHV